MSNGYIFRVKLWMVTELYSHLIQAYCCSDAYYDYKYLWNGWRYRQAENGIITHDSSHAGQKNGELWFTNSSALLLAAILKAYVCLSVPADGWKVAAAVILPVFSTFVSLSVQTGCISSDLARLPKILGLWTEVGPGA